LPIPPEDDDNPFGEHSDSLGAVNRLLLGVDLNNENLYAVVENRTLYHHFKPLSDFLSKPSVQALGLFTESFTPRIVEANCIECFYLINDAQDVAVGWVHNADAYWRKAVYINSHHQHYVECTTPIDTTIALPGFADSTNFKISYHPTRATMTELPADDTVGVNSGPDGIVTLNLGPGAFNGTFPLSQTGEFRNHLDTLHSDYAFIIATDLIKRLNNPSAFEETGIADDWDFTVFPNPARYGFSLRFVDEDPKSIELLDLSGRVVRSWGLVTDRQPEFSIVGLAHGAYWVRATDGTNRKTKKLLIH
jgi:hypothetical protein